MRNKIKNLFYVDYLGSVHLLIFQRRHPITGWGAWRRRTQPPQTYNGTCRRFLRNHTLNIQSGADFCATILRVQKKRRFLCHCTSCTKEGADFRATILHVQKGRQFPHHCTSRTKGSADFCDTIYYI